jgi:hypothetical protein
MDKMALQPIEGQPGLFRDSDTGQVVNIRDFRESDKYDTIVIPAQTAIAAGTEFVFFADLNGKRTTDTNLMTQRKLSAGESMVLDRIGLYFRLAVGNTTTKPRDLKKTFENSYYSLRINEILQDEGPAIKFPSGYGVYGQTNETDDGIVSIGVPATASAARLVKKQMLNQNHELNGTLRFDARSWAVSPGTGSALGPLPQGYVMTPTLDEPVMITNYLHGLIRAAVTK